MDRISSACFYMGGHNSFNVFATWVLLNPSQCFHKGDKTSSVDFPTCMKPIYYTYTNPVLAGHLVTILVFIPHMKKYPCHWDGTVGPRACLVDKFSTKLPISNTPRQYITIFTGGPCGRVGKVAEFQRS